MFDEKAKEKYKGKEIPVWKSPKYDQSKQKAMEIIKAYDRIEEGDFWILMNTINGGETMMYSGLIISHNGCLKINDAQEAGKKFVPSCVTLDKEGYNGSLVYTYCNDEQGIYEVGEVSAANCKNSYPYAMAYKRLFDRVVLKLCGLAYDGVYSDSEADEFKQRYDDIEKPAEISMIQLRELEELMKMKNVPAAEVCEAYKISDISKLSLKQYENCRKTLQTM